MIQARLGHYFDNAVVLFFSGLSNHRVATAFSEYTQNLSFADPIRQLGVPKLLRSLDTLALYAEGAHYASGWKPPRVVLEVLVEPWTRFVLPRAKTHAATEVAFAFVIHFLSQEYVKKVESIELLSKVSPPMFIDALARAMAYAPPFV